MLLSLFLPKLAFSQNDLSLDDYTVICETSTDNIEKSLKSGVGAFLLEIEETTKDYLVINNKNATGLKSILQRIHLFLNKNNKTLVTLIFKGNFEQNHVIALLNDFYPNKFSYYKGKEWPQINLLRNSGIQVFALFDSNIASTSIQQIRNKKIYLNRFSSNPLNKIILFNAEATSDSILFKNCIELWKTTGKPPNLLLAPKISIPVLKKIADSLNRTRRFRGIITYVNNKKGLEEIYWTKSPGTITPSIFSFPLTEYEQVLSPYKNGFQFTPTEVIHHSSLKDTPRIFTAHDINLEEKLIYDFSFNNKIVNAIDKKWNKTISKDIKFLNDPIRGNVLHLKKHNSYIDYSKENSFNFETPISVSVWVKPDSIPDYMGIIGLGMAFSLKLTNGNPAFTMATIKDHIIKYQLEKNKWYHLVAVYNPNTTIVFYIDGKKIGDSDAAKIIPSNQSLVIGNNIWGEQFYGSIDDLKIWDRGLSPDEVNTLFNKKIATNNYPYYWIIGMFVFLMISLTTYWIRKRTRIQPKLKQPFDKFKIAQKHTQNSLYLFGNFHLQLKSETQNDLSFSPLQEQLLSFLILSTLEDKDGVNTNKLTDTFWPGVSKLKAKENRNGNIRKLRMVLSEIDGLELIFEDKLWKIKNDSNLSIDIFEYFQLKKVLIEALNQGKLSIINLESFLVILAKGNILQNLQKEWADYFKNKISNEIENLLFKIYNEHHTDLSPDLNIKIGKTVLLFDNLNEGALKILISEMVSLGKHGQAQSIYNSFLKSYEKLYDEPFQITFQSILRK